MENITQNRLFYGDNLKIIREYLQNEYIDLIYLDPPFNSNRNYNVLFKNENGTDSEAQIEAFEDTWHWNQEAEDIYIELIEKSSPQISRMIGAFREFIGSNPMVAYLVMMTIRLIELHRVLKSTGSLYLHCDSTASHYLKIVLDIIFGKDNFRNEIIWQRSNPKSNISVNFPNCTDTILRYTKTNKYTYHQPYIEHNPDYVESAYKHSDENGQYQLLPLLNPNDDRPNLTYEFLGVTRVWRWTKERMQKAYEDGLVVQVKPGAVPRYKKYIDDSKGRTITNCWTDILQASGNESLNYPTQKPIKLLERIIQASSNEGDLILDPFAGCGAAIVAAEKLKRKWIGIDITHLAIALLKYRLKDSFNIVEKLNYDVIGEPKDLSSAYQLAQDDRYQFQWWALSLIKAKPIGGQSGSKRGKKGKYAGIDGEINFIDSHNGGKPKKIIVQVKSGKVKSGDIRDLAGTVERENAAIGVFITLEEPTKDMKKEAVSAGQYKSQLWNKSYSKIQILTIEEIFNGANVKMPPSHSTFKKAKPEKKRWIGQISLF